MAGIQSLLECMRNQCGFAKSETAEIKYYRELGLKHPVNQVAEVLYSYFFNA
jgi:hypothetical protein